jgi:hypothetical protein
MTSSSPPRSGSYPLSKSDAGTLHACSQRLQPTENRRMSNTRDFHAQSGRHDFLLSKTEHGDPRLADYRSFLA